MRREGGGGGQEGREGGEETVDKGWKGRVGGLEQHDLVSGASGE